MNRGNNNHPPYSLKKRAALFFSLALFIPPFLSTDGINHTLLEFFLQYIRLLFFLSDLAVTVKPATQPH